jgi:hypothetical protein
LLVPIGRHDEAALEVGLRIRGDVGGTVTALSYGTSDGAAVDALRNALASGADDAVLVEDPMAFGRDSHATAEVLAQASRQYRPDLLLFGRYGSAWEMGVTPQLAAGILRASFVQGVDLLRSGSSSDSVGTVVAAIRRSGRVRLRNSSLASIETAYLADIERIDLDSLHLPDGWDSTRVPAGVVEAPAPPAVGSPLGDVADLADRMVASLARVNR